MEVVGDQMEGNHHAAASRRNRRGHRTWPHL